MSSVAAILTRNVKHEASARVRRATLNIAMSDRCTTIDNARLFDRALSERRERRVAFGPAELSNRADPGLRVRRVLGSYGTARLAVGPRNIFAKTHAFQCTAFGRLEAARGFPFREVGLRR